MSEPKSLLASNKIIIALDTDVEQAKKIVENTKDLVSLYKVGPVLWMRWGREAFRFFAHHQKQFLLDFKFHDIANTVQETVKSLMEMDRDYQTIWGLTIHALGGYQMLKTITTLRDSLKEERRIKIFGVTVLTSLRERDLYRIGINRAVPAQVKKLAVLAMDADLDGVVVSAHEIHEVRKACGQDFLCVVAGIRLSMDARTTWDQKRVVSPIEALEKGADYLVVGRDIYNAQDPRERVEALTQAIEGWERRQGCKGMRRRIWRN